MGLEIDCMGQTGSWLWKSLLVGGALALLTWRNGIAAGDPVEAVADTVVRIPRWAFRVVLTGT